MNFSENLQVRMLQSKLLDMRLDEMKAEYDYLQEKREIIDPEDNDEYLTYLLNCKSSLLSEIENIEKYIDVLNKSFDREDESEEVVNE